MAGILKFICPQGFKISQQKVKKLKQRENDTENDTPVFTFLQASCWPCPQKSYSLHRGEAINYHNTTMIGPKSSETVSQDDDKMSFGVTSVHAGVIVF